MASSRSASVWLCASTAADPAEEWLPQPSQTPVARPGAVGDAGIDHGHGNSAAEAAAEQVGPELGFRQDEQARLEGVEISANGPGQVERAIEDAVGAEALAGQLLAGAGGGGDEQVKLREGAVQLANQAADGQHLAHGDGMEPDDGRWPFRSRNGGNPAQAFGQPLAVLVRGGHPPQPPGGAGHQGRKQGEVVEKENHA